MSLAVFLLTLTVKKNPHLYSLLVLYPTSKTVQVDSEPIVNPLFSFASIKSKTATNIKIATLQKLRFATWRTCPSWIGLYQENIESVKKAIYLLKPRWPWWTGNVPFWVWLPSARAAIHQHVFPWRGKERKRNYGMCRSINMAYRYLCPLSAVNGADFRSFLIIALCVRACLCGIVCAEVYAGGCECRPLQLWPHTFTHKHLAALAIVCVYVCMWKCGWGGGTSIFGGGFGSVHFA